MYEASAGVRTLIMAVQPMRSPTGNVLMMGALSEVMLSAWGQMRFVCACTHRWSVASHVLTSARMCADHIALKGRDAQYCCPVTTNGCPSAWPWVQKPRDKSLWPPNLPREHGLHDHPGQARGGCNGHAFIDTLQHKA